MKKIIQYKNNNLIFADNEIAQKFQKLIDTPECRMYSGRRIFRLINRNKIRMILDAAHYPENFMKTK